ncbi:OLC1v1013320C1 [Oldenlandia corymbosa var. corymbosa]|uniref:OLC1v1013320C1 n=1 Tax=Oldenlandia corymbosa var. corymbosa TaxID=529605 RepID=A0AAV1DYE9_OLDCO|nr:OLC1v1013320C1 [Oldenlandia corymbosa var. corymbosa]
MGSLIFSLLYFLFFPLLVLCILKFLFLKFMGGKSSKNPSSGRYSSYSSSSNSWNDYGNQQYPYAQPSQTYAPPPVYQNYDVPPPEARKRLERKYSRIEDDYNSLEQVTDALSRAGLESSNLIVGIDFTKSNEWTGSRSFNRKSLHHLSGEPNPYEQAISIIGRTLSKFDEDNLIPCFGFGDASTHDQEVFSFYPDDRFCEGFEEVLTRYRELVPQLRLAGPTSFAPVIEMAITIVEQSGGQYHVLLIIADGQVTRSVDTGRGQLSPQERKTVEAIVKASQYPLSIILVGVGDGPWDMMREFDDNIPARAFDNFQFVNFTEIMSKNIHRSRKEAEFALSALMEIPSQYKATLELNILGASRGNAINRIALPPPNYGTTSYGASKPSRNSSFPPIAPSSRVPERPVGTSQSASNYENNLCPICLTDPKNMAFGCGHQTCCSCGQDLQSCPICREPIQTRIKLY